ncbi:MAG: carotenoid 1,2-hydratase [Candidatus Latescibacteria bacterium]|nr:carotenoid 1,2-hydratase [Candidatus Latescibacterota bacterium]MBT5830668.1 carotenoid 1,2-hydratase [Candidatus Latescibacterota bacterium]
MGWTQGEAEEWQIAVPDYEWSFPQDHWAREGYKTEWWYFTGHLKSENGREFGYQFTFFRVGLLPTKPDLDSDWAANNLIMGHAAISDLETGQHYFSESIHRVTPLLGGFGVYPDTLLAWSRGPVGTQDRWLLRWNGDAFDFSAVDAGKDMRIDLRTRPKKSLIFQGPKGYSKKGVGESAASQYYSFTRLETEGSVTVAGETFDVVGESWMDKEFGSNQLDENQVGWDWFSLQLDDGREVMLYVLRDKTNAVDYARGTIVLVDGQTQYLKRDEFEIQETGSWTSPETDAIYPAGWIIKVGDEILTVQSEMKNQENQAELVGTLFYWEGAVRVLRAGKKVGRGYVELTGYGAGSVPGL